LGQELSPGIPGDAHGTLVRLLVVQAGAIGVLFITAAILIHPAAARAHRSGPSLAGGALREPGPGDGELGQA
jgi:hypothetical protein